MKTENLILAAILGFVLLRSKQGAKVGFATESEFLNFVKRKHVKEFANAYLDQEKRINQFAEKLELLRYNDQHSKANTLDKQIDKERQKLDLMVIGEATKYKVQPYYFIEAVNYYS